MKMTEFNKLTSVEKKIKEAREATERLLPEYFNKTLNSRIAGSGDQAGSWFAGIDSADELKKELFNSSRVWEEYSHPDIMPGCVGFKTDIAGFDGMIPVEDLDCEVELTFTDRKNTGWASAEISAGREDKIPAPKEVNFAVVIVGEEQGEAVIYTLHPGAPVKVSRVKSTPEVLGHESCSPQDAAKLGFTHVKLTA